MTTGKTIALTRRTFVGKVMSLHEHFFYILDLRPLLDICVVNMFLKFMACLFMCLSLGPLRSKCQGVIKPARILFEMPVVEKIGKESDGTVR